jgi:hypothetical protein
LQSFTRTIRPPADTTPILIQLERKFEILQVLERKVPQWTMDNQQLRTLISRRPFRPFQIATSSGDHYAVLEEADIFNNRRRPQLYVIFTDDGLAHWIESDDIVSVTTL